MKLNLAERIAILQILPVEGDFTTLKILREVQSEVGFSEEDHKEFGIKKFNDKGEEDPNGTQVQWGAAGAKEVEKNLGDKAKEMVREALLKLEGEKKLTPRHMTIYEKFVQEKAEEEKK